MSRLVVRVIEEGYESQVCVFKHSIQDNFVILQNDPRLIDEIELELEAALSYLKSIQVVKKREINMSSAYQEAVAEGYISGSLGFSEIIDRGIAEGKPCENCGGRIEYRPLMKGKHYRAFAICTECGKETEF